MLHGLTGPDDGTLFLAVLTLGAWAGWATFAVAVLVEIPAQVRGVPPHACADSVCSSRSPAASSPRRSPWFWSRPRQVRPSDR